MELKQPVQNQTKLIHNLHGSVQRMLQVSIPWYIYLSLLDLAIRHVGYS